MIEGHNEQSVGINDCEGTFEETKIEERLDSNQHFHDNGNHRREDRELDSANRIGRSIDMNGAAEEKENIDALHQNHNDENESIDGIDQTGSESPMDKLPKPRYHTPKIFQDAITVLIPLDVTADLKIAIKKTRAKRISSIYKRFPSLKKEAKNHDENSDDPMLDDEDEENARDKDEKQPPKKRKKIENVPHPDQFGSVLDYLEAKYVKGVMLEEEDNAPMLDDKSEGQGSVYSKDSFLDDTDLQRDVAEQVMASTTLTKLELEHEDGDFFVNVGNLEVENDDYGENYDPLQDKENKITKKRKKSSAAVTAPKASDTKTPPPKNKKTKVEQPIKKKEPPSAKSKKSVSSTSSTKSKKTQDKGLRLAAKKAKSHSDSLFKKAAAMIKKLPAENLPRMKTKLKVALKCPKNKKAGDDITFSNPHNPGQKLRVKVPKDCFPGGTFKVTVPVKHRPGDSDEKDRNKLPRDLQEALDLFGKAYDEWCTAQSKVDSSFETFKEKQGKFDKLAKLFPTNLVTPIDSNYLKQVVRRARQNKYKRSKTAAIAAAKNEKVMAKTESVAESKTEEGSTREDIQEDEDTIETKNYRIFNIPTTGVAFERKKFVGGDFVLI